MKIIFNLLIMSLLSNFSMAQMTNKKLSIEQIETYFTKLPAGVTVTMAVESMEGKPYFSYRADERVPSASVIKIPILIALMEKVKSGAINLNEIHTLTNADKVGGAGDLMNVAEGKQLIIREIAQEMIRTSDNTATNILIRKVGMNFVNQNLAELGITKTRLNRAMMDTEAVKQGRENYVNVLEINALLRLIYNQKIATPILCDAMFAMLKNCEDDTTIPRNLPKNLKIAHKTGTLSYVRGDAGIVFTDTPFVISIFVEGFREIETAEQIIGDLAQICWENLK